MEVQRYLSSFVTKQYVTAMKLFALLQVEGME